MKYLNGDTGGEVNLSPNLPPGDDRPGDRLLLHHGPLPRLELAEPRLLRLPRPLHLRPLLHP